MNRPDPGPSDPARTVGAAVQRLAAVRLGRGFVPLALLFLVGVGRMLAGGEGLLLALGAPVSALAMLAHALRTVQLAFARPLRPWMGAAAAGGVLPPAYGVWVLGWLGLKALAGGGGLLAMASALLVAALGAWVLRAWLQILELHRLAQTMAVAPPTGGDGTP